MADENSANCISNTLLELAPKILLVAEKRGLAAKEAKDLLQLYNQSKDGDDDVHLSARKYCY